MSAHEAPQLQRSLTDGSCSYLVNIAIIGYQSAGKTTVLNGILGDIYGETGLNCVTKTMNVYQEVASLPKSGFNESNEENKDDSKEEVERSVAQKVLSKTKNNNKKQDKNEEKLKAWRKDYSLAAWWKYFTNQPAPAKQELLPTDTNHVTINSLIPKKNVNDNGFRIFDFPGFGDINVEGYTLDKIQRCCHEDYLFDCIFYVIDCQNGLNTIAEIETFDKIFKNILGVNTDRNKNDSKFEEWRKKVEIIFLFNKCDHITINDLANKEIIAKKEWIKKRLKNKYVGIPDKQCKFFKLSARNMLCERIIEEKDYAFVERQTDQNARKIIETHLDEFGCDYVGKQQIRQWKKREKLDIKQRIDRYHEEMKQFQKTCDNDSNNSEPDSDNDVNSNEEFRKYLQELRHFSKTKNRVIDKFNTMEIKSLVDIDDFMSLVRCLLVERQNNTQFKMQFYRKHTSNSTIESFTTNKLVRMIDTHMPEIVKNNGKNGGSIISSFVERTLIHIEHIWDIIKKENFIFDRIVHNFIDKGYLTPDLLESLVNDEDSRNQITHTSFIAQLGETCVDAWLIIYKNNNTYNTQERIKQWIQFIDKFGQSKQKKIKYFQLLVSGYPCASTRMNAKMPNYLNTKCYRAIDLVNYHFGINTSQQFEYEDYKSICVKYISIEDKVFDSILLAMKECIGRHQ